MLDRPPGSGVVSPRRTDRLNLRSEAAKLANSRQAGAAPWRQRAGAGYRWLAPRNDASDTREHFTIALDWVCEIVVRASAAFDRGRKLPLYARYGVKHAWIVDVDAKYVEVKRSRDGAWQDLAVFTSGDIVRAEPFDAIELDMTRVWGPPPACDAFGVR